MPERGQTIHDYLLGIVLVMLTIAGVFAFFPDVFVPFQEPVESEDRQMAGELATELVEVDSTMDGRRTVNLTALERTLEDPDALGVLVNRSGIPEWKQVNVTVRDDETVLVRGESSTTGSAFYEGSSAPPATAVRTIQAQNRSHACADSCELVVRVWEG
ncbi:hypothetical protein BRD08_10520 [Halobacteriales archaeon SW_10_66_29]|nr:MAG: hypothetical protein BRD08_10520 [Halobacteriales archaeon SW_10_66_29]